MNGNVGHHGPARWQNTNYYYYYFSEDIPEFERVLITRYRCGSHNLKIEKGRYDRIERNMRLYLPVGTNTTYKSFKFKMVTLFKDTFNRMSYTFLFRQLNILDLRI